MIYGYNAQLNDYNVSEIRDYGNEFLEEILKIRKTPEVGEIELPALRT